jgi:hypothetical protein
MIRIILIAWSVLSIPAAFVLWCVCRVSGMCSRDEEKRGER